jgi:predicted DNA-binding transcriptional regulator AlpA
MTTHSAAPRTLLRIEEVAELTGVPVSTLCYWRHRDRGEGPPMFRIGRRVVADADEVNAWIATHRKAAR